MAADVYERSLNGLQRKYERAFVDFISSEMGKDNAFELVYNYDEGQKRSNMYNFLKRNYNDFQSPYVADAFELGKSFYSLQRDRQEKKLNANFGAFEGIALTKSLLNENITPYWTMTGLLKKVYDNEALLDWAAAIGSKGVADLSRNSTIASANADDKTVKVLKLRLSSNACEFCRTIADKQENYSYTYARSNSKLSMHANCNCSVSYEFANLSARYYNSLSRSQQRRINSVLYEQNNG